MAEVDPFSNVRSLPPALRPATSFALSLVILATAIPPCILGCTYLRRKILRTDDTAKALRESPAQLKSNKRARREDTTLIVTHPALLCSAGFSVLLAIGLVIHSGLVLQRPNRSDHEPYQISLLVLLTLTSRANIVYESAFLYLINPPLEYRRRLLCASLIYCFIPLLSLLILLGRDTQRGTTFSKVSLALSFAEHFFVVVGYSVAFRKVITVGWRVRVIFGGSIFACSAMDIASVTFFVLEFVSKDITFFSQWTCTTLGSICIIRYPVLNVLSRWRTGTSSNVSSRDLPAASQASLVDQQVVIDKRWQEDSGYHTIVYGDKSAISQFLAD